MKKGTFILVLSTFKFTFLTFQIKLAITVYKIIYWDIFILLKDNYKFETASFIIN